MKNKNILVKIGTFFIPILGGFYGALAGAENGNKALRRIMIPFMLFGLAYQQTENPLSITIMTMCFFISMGYGIPGTGDNGSILGRFYYNLFNQNHHLADVFTRGTIGLFIDLSLISISVINHNWIVYGLGSLGIILTNALLSWRNLGQYTLFNKKLNWSETLTWGLITLFAVLIIKL